MHSNDNSSGSRYTYIILPIYIWNINQLSTRTMKTFGICKASTHAHTHTSVSVRNRSRCSRQQATEPPRWYLICIAVWFSPDGLFGTFRWYLRSSGRCVPPKPVRVELFRQRSRLCNGKVGGKADSKYGAIGSPMSSKQFQWRCLTTRRSLLIQNQRARCG